LVADSDFFTPPALWADLKIADESAVGRFLFEFDFLPYDSTIRESFIKQFRRVLWLKSAAVFSFLRENEAARLPVNEKLVRKAIDLPLIGDYWTVIAAADRLKPGIINAIYSNQLE